MESISFGQMIWKIICNVSRNYMKRSQPDSFQELICQLLWSLFISWFTVLLVGNLRLTELKMTFLSQITSSSFHEGSPYYRLSNIIRPIYVPYSNRNSRAQLFKFVASTKLFIICSSWGNRAIFGYFMHVASDMHPYILTWFALYALPILILYWASSSHLAGSRLMNRHGLIQLNLLEPDPLLG